MAADIKALISRMEDIAKRSEKASPQLRAALTRIGLTVSSEAILNVRRRGLIDTGRLINSIRYELFSDEKGDGVKIGSFGVPYAAVHEFGFQGSVSVRSYSRTLTQVFGRPVQARTVTVRPHERFLRIPARPYLRPAVRKHTNLIINVLRQAVGMEK